MGGSFKFQVKLAGQWVDYPQRADDKICAAYKQGKKEVTFKLKVGNFKNTYTIDFIKMIQASPGSEKTRQVRAPYDLMKKFNADAKDSGPAGFAGDDCSDDDAPTPKMKAAPPLNLGDKKKIEDAIKKEMKNVTTSKRWKEIIAKAEKEGCDKKIIDVAKKSEELVKAVEKAMEGNDVKVLVEAEKKFISGGLAGPIVKIMTERKKEMGFAKARALVTKVMADTAITKGKDQGELEAMKKTVIEAAKEVAPILGEEGVRPLRDRVRKVHNAIQDAKGAIRVFSRTRPLNQREKDTGSKACLNFKADKMTVVCSSDDGDSCNFSFDNTFNPGTQADVFAEMKELVQSAYDGYNITVFAYGQTGAGKTFTMYGPDPSPEKDPGVVLRTIEEIYALKKSYEEVFKVTVSVQMIELYCSALKDLLYSGGTKALEIGVRKMPDGSITLENAQNKVEGDSKALWNRIQEGFKTRQTAATNMNATSSRSHCIVVVHVNAVNKQTKQEIKSKITLVDLAGSERVKDSGVEGANLKEAIEINKSLTALGDVMEQLTSGKGANFRNHKLTEILQDSLGGAAKTLMFANVSPASINFAETMMTLKWAQRAKKVVNDKGAAGVKAKAKAKAGASPKAKAGLSPKAKPKPKAKK